MERNAQKALGRWICLILLTLIFAVLTSCGESDTSDGDDTHSHKYDEWTVVQEASCTEDGLKEKTCSCGKKKTKKIEKGHTIVVDAAVAPGCSTEGLTEGSHCSVCGEIIEAQTVITAVGHVDNNGDNKCDNCGEILLAPSEGLEYNLNEDGKTCTLVGIGSCTDFQIIIPSVYNDCMVTRIGEGAFKRRENVGSITIPSTIKSIGEFAFLYCENLKSVYYSGDVMSWLNVAFANDSSNPLYEGAELFLNYKPVTDLIIPADVTKIGSFAFINCENLTSVTIPGNVQSIGESAFEDCCNLTKVTIEDGVKSIGESAFERCDSLASVIIPDSVTNVGEYAFCDCKKLKNIVIPNSLTHISGAMFSNCSDLTSVVIPNGVKKIDYSAFYGCKNLAQITLPDELEYIGMSAFYDTAYYNDSTNWIDGFLYIGNCLIYVNENTSGIYEIKDGTKSIIQDAFRFCNNIADITIPDSVTNAIIYPNAPDLRKIIVRYKGDISSWLDAYVYIILRYDLYIGDKLVTDVSITDGITKISKYTFSACNSIVRVCIPNSVTSIDEYAFSGCTNLTSITIPDSVTSISDIAFLNCTSLKKVYYKGTADEWSKMDFGGLFNYNGSLTSATRYYFSETQPTDDGNWWHYVDGVVTEW